MPSLELLDTESTETAVTQAAASTLADMLENLPDVRRRICQAWLDGLEATKWSSDSTGRKKVYEPDHRQRAECASKLAAYLEGMPGQTLIVKTPRGSGSGGRLVGDDQEAAFDAAMTASPALREAMRKRLERAERAAVK